MGDAEPAGEESPQQGFARDTLIMMNVLQEWQHEIASVSRFYFSDVVTCGDVDSPNVHRLWQQACWGYYTFVLEAIERGVYTGKGYAARNAMSVHDRVNKLERLFLSQRPRDLMHNGCLHLCLRIKKVARMAVEAGYDARL